MAVHYVFSKLPHWYKCKRNGDGLICEQDVLLGFCRWDETKEAKFVDVLEIDTDGKWKWVTYPTRGNPPLLRVPVTNEEKYNWPKGVECRLGAGVEYGRPLPGESEIDAFYREWTTRGEAMKKEGLALKAIARKFRKIVKRKTIIPIEVFVPK